MSIIDSIKNKLFHRSAPLDENSKEAEAGEKRSKFRKLPKWLNIIVILFTCTMTIYHLYTAVSGVPNWVIHRPTHVMFFMVIGFITLKSTKKDSTVALVIDCILALISFLIWIYIEMHYDRISTFINYVTKIYTLDKIVIVLLILFTLELTRRNTGWILTSIAIFFMLQTLFAKSFPGFLKGPNMSLNAYLNNMFFTADGFFGSIISTSASFVFLFIVFGSFLSVTKVGDYFIDLASDVTRNMRGGSAKTSILASGLFGSISGSQVANVYATGTFTIPLMKANGFSPLFAGALEAVASSGGAILPPVMGATAFLVADFVGVPYLSVAVAAIIPALLYYFSLWCYVDSEVQKMGLEKAQNIPAKHPKSYYLKKIYLILPMGALVVMLLSGYSTFMAASVAIASTLVVALINDPKSLSPKNIIKMLDQAGRTGTSIAIPLACASIVVASIHLSGTGLKLTTMIMRASGNSLPIAMLLTMLVTIFLGMGLPTPAAYTIVAIFAPTALIQLGVSKLAAHLFCFYYACLAAITPPVALAAYAGAAISGASANKTGFYAVKLGIVAFVIPWIFLFAPELLLQGSIPGVIMAIITGFIGVYELVSGIQGYCLEQKISLPVRLVMIIAAFGLIIPGTVTDIIGVLPLIAVVIYVVMKKKKAGTVKE